MNAPDIRFGYPSLGDGSILVDTHLKRRLTEIHGETLPTLQNSLRYLNLYLELQEKSLAQIITHVSDNLFSENVNLTAGQVNISSNNAQIIEKIKSVLSQFHREDMKSNQMMLNTLANFVLLRYGMKSLIKEREAEMAKPLPVKRQTIELPTSKLQDGVIIGRQSADIEGKTRINISPENDPRSDFSRNYIGFELRYDAASREYHFFVKNLSTTRVAHVNNQRLAPTEETQFELKYNENIKINIKMSNRNFALNIREDNANYLISFEEVIEA